MTFVNKLTALAVQNAKPDSEKITKLFDGEGLYLEISKKGKKGWRLKYYFEERERRMSLGIYPDVSLEKARKRKRQVREMVADGIDPSERRRIDKIQGNQDTFKSVAEEWFEFESGKLNWVEAHKTRVKRIMEKYLYPWVGETLITKITPPDLRQTLHKIELQGKFETAKRAKQIASAICSYGVTTGKAVHDIGPDVKKIVLKPPKPKHRASITDPDEVGRLMLAIDSYEGSIEVKSALRLAPLTFVRPGELRHAEWKEINWDEAIWTIKGEKMKTGFDHIVPLSRQALEVLRDIQQFTGNYDYIFPSARSHKRPMSENAVLVALRNMGYTKEQMTGHGFRAMARTLLDEELEFRIDLIEHQLAHTVRDAHGRAYNRTKHLKKRHEMMQTWANHLDLLKEKARMSASFHSFANEFAQIDDIRKGVTNPTVTH